MLSGAALEFGVGAAFAELFEERHRSAMTTTCATQEEAIQTQAHHKAEHGYDTFVDAVSATQFNVFRVGGNEVCPSVK